MKKILSVILALVMALSVVSITALAAGDYADFDGTITLGETRPVNLPGLTQYSKYAIIQFIPERDGLYAISSDSRGNADCDPYLELYEDKLDEYVVKVDDVDKNTSDFYLEYYFEAGRVYYFLMGNYRSATVWDITLKCLHEEYEDGKCISCSADCDHVKVNNMFNSCPCGEKFDGPVISLANGKYTANVRCNDEEYTFYKFVPEKAGIFHITTNSASNKIDPCCDIYDTQGNLVASHDDILADENKNFDLVCKLEAGETYFIGMWDYEGNQREWSFTFEDITTHEVDKTVTGDDGLVTTVKEEHELTFVEQKDANCKEKGCTAYAYCEKCADFEAIGKNDIPTVDHSYDEDWVCEWCGEVDPVMTCDCDCHSNPNGIVGFFWKIINFFNKLFRINPVCECGVEHY